MILRLLPIALTTLPALAGEPLQSSKDPIIETPAEVSPWRIGVGVMWRNIGELSVKPDLQTGRFSGNFFTPNPAAGSADTYADRTYDNGFVNQGAATPLTGLTTFWGYQQPSQVAGGNLNYSASGGLALGLPGTGADDASTEVAPYIELSYLKPVRPNLLAGFTGGLSLVGLDSKSSSRLAASEIITNDTYAINGVNPPAAPYSGTFTGPGPLINNRPTSRDFTLSPSDSTGSYHFANQTDLSSLALGGELQWEPASRCYINFGAGAVLNYADWTASWSADLVNPATPALATVGVADKGDEFLLGLYVKGGAGYRINEQWSVEAFFRYDWTETLEANVGPTQFEIDLTGWSLGIGFDFSF